MHNLRHSPPLHRNPTAKDIVARRYEELDRVTLAVPVVAEKGQRLPAGASGTVVAVFRGGAAYIVEFAIPFHAVVTVSPDAIRA